MGVGKMGGRGWAADFCGQIKARAVLAEKGGTWLGTPARSGGEGEGDTFAQRGRKWKRGVVLTAREESLLSFSLKESVL
jgi:hypothetical protein